MTQLAKADLSVSKLLEEVEERWCRHMAYSVEHNAILEYRIQLTEGNNDDQHFFFKTKKFLNWICPSFKDGKPAWALSEIKHCPQLYIPFPNNFPGNADGYKMNILKVLDLEGTILFQLFLFQKKKKSLQRCMPIF